MIRKHKKYSKPRKAYDAARIREENRLAGVYGLKKKREIWKAEAEVRKMRRLAKRLITKSEDEKTAFIKKLETEGFNVKSIADILALNMEDWLKRRLQSVVLTRGIARTPNEARQLIVHKHIAVGKRVVNVPSFIVDKKSERDIEIVGLKQPGTEVKNG
ncbi:MAG: 30S ribosomal protein S4 [Nanoarchaeota archaeon]